VKILLQTQWAQVHRNRKNFQLRELHSQPPVRHCTSALETPVALQCGGGGCFVRLVLAVYWRRSKT
jgi:hypothetical protein